MLLRGPKRGNKRQDEDSRAFLPAGAFCRGRDLRNPDIYVFVAFFLNEKLGLADSLVMEAKKFKNRYNYRKPIHKLKVVDLSIFAKYPNFAKSAEILDISVNGMLLLVQRKHLSKKLKNAFNLQDLEGRYMSLKIETMNLDLDALVVRTKSVDKDHFEVAIDYSESAPEYWRECLFDMLPDEDEE